MKLRFAQPDFDRFLDRKYDVKDNNCLDLVLDFYNHNFGVNLAAGLPSFLGGATGYHGDRSLFKRLDKPTRYCICVFKPYNVREETAHVGIYWFGEVFHIENDSAVRFTPLRLMLVQFASVRFYEYVGTDN